MLKTPFFKVSISLLLLAALCPLPGCTGQQETEALTALQSALSSLTQDRSLAEQFVRDVKGSADPSDPNLVTVMQSYQDARDQYNRYLDKVESGNTKNVIRSLRDVNDLSVQNATSDFLADATSMLKPDLKVRRVTFQRAIVIPPGLQEQVAKLPKRVRERMIDKFDDQVRWRSWGEL